MRKLLAAIVVALLLACGLSAPALAQQTRAQLLTALNTCWATNGIGAITAASVKVCQTNLINSITFLFGDPFTFTTPVTINSNVTLTGNLSVPLSHQFNQSAGAHVQRLNDRVFMAGGTVNDGSGTSPNLDWWSVMTHNAGLPSDANFAQVLILYDITQPYATAAVPQVGLAVAAETAPGISSSSPRAIEYFAYNNPTGGAAPSIWGLYGEAHYLVAGAGNTFGYELEVRAEVAAANAWQPYTTPGSGLVGELIGCGAGLSAAHNCTVAMIIGSNPQPFSAGIIFSSGGLSNEGINATNAAILMPANYEIQWFKAANTLAALQYGDPTFGMVISGNGTGNDVTLVNFSGGTALAVNHNSTNVQFGGNFSVPGMTTSAAAGTGSLCVGAGNSVYVKTSAGACL